MGSQGNRLSKKKIFMIVNEVWNYLPETVGPDWKKVQAQIWLVLREFDEPKMKVKILANKILELLKPHQKKSKTIDGVITKLEEGLKPTLRKPKTLRGERSAIGSVAFDHGKICLDSDDTYRSEMPTGVSMAQKTPAGSRRPSGICRFVEIPVYYATDRLKGNAEKLTEYYLDNRREEDDLYFGVAKVSVPDNHKKGNLETPWIWDLKIHWGKIGIESDPDKHIELRKIEELSWNGSVKDIKSTLSGAEKNEILIFVHGYSTSFADAMRRAAQLAYDLNFPGLVVAYSWPSANLKFKYTWDADVLAWVKTHFFEYLRHIIAESGANKVHVLAHSMGNRILVETLEDIDISANYNNEAERLGHVIFAAPDVSAGRFRQFLERLKHQVADTLTLYASSNDIALSLSKKVNGEQRAGDSSPDLLIVHPPLDTIDATNVDTNLDAHSSFSKNRTVISDLYELIVKNLQPDNRFNIRRSQKDTRLFWEFVP